MYTNVAKPLSIIWLILLQSWFNYVLNCCIFCSCTMKCIYDAMYVGCVLTPWEQLLNACQNVQFIDPLIYTQLVDLLNYH